MKKAIRHQRNENIVAGATPYTQTLRPILNDACGALPADSIREPPLDNANETITDVNEKI
jgi:hypothetical protein